MAPQLSLPSFLPAPAPTARSAAGLGGRARAKLVPPAPQQPHRRPATIPGRPAAAGRPEPGPLPLGAGGTEPAALPQTELGRHFGRDSFSVAKSRVELVEVGRTVD